jgi:DNA polymerase-4
VAADLAAQGYVGKTIGIKLRYDDFKSVTRDLTLDAYTADAQIIRQSAGLCLKRAPLAQRLRLLGVRVATLVKAEKCQEFITNQPLARVEYAHTAINSEVPSDQLF